MGKHFVEFYSPGTFISETTRKPIDKWDVDEAQAMARALRKGMELRLMAFSSLRESGQRGIWIAKNPREALCIIWAGRF